MPSLQRVWRIRFHYRWDYGRAILEGQLQWVFLEQCCSVATILGYLARQSLQVDSGIQSCCGWGRHQLLRKGGTDMRLLQYRSWGRASLLFVSFRIRHQSKSSIRNESDGVNVIQLIQSIWRRIPGLGSRYYIPIGAKSLGWAMSSRTWQRIRWASQQRRACWHQSVSRNIQGRFELGWRLRRSWTANVSIPTGNKTRSFARRYEHQPSAARPNNLPQSSGMHAGGKEKGTLNGSAQGNPSEFDSESSWNNEYISVTVLEIRIFLNLFWWWEGTFE